MQPVQDAAARIIAGTKKNDYITPYCNLCIGYLRVKLGIDFKILLRNVIIWPLARYITAEYIKELISLYK